MATTNTPIHREKNRPGAYAEGTLTNYFPPMAHDQVLLAFPFLQSSSIWISFSFRGLRMVVGAGLKRPAVSLEWKGKFSIQMLGPMNLNLQAVALDESTVKLPLGDSSGR